jgi:hypothetical protein
MSVSEWNDTRGVSIRLTRCLVFDFTDSHDSILVIVHFDHENSCLWWDFFVRYFSRTSVDTFKLAVVCLFVGLLVSGHPLLIFLPGIVVETCAGEDGGRGGCAPQRRDAWGCVEWLCCHFC